MLEWSEWSALSLGFLFSPVNRTTWSSQTLNVQTPRVGKQITGWVADWRCLWRFPLRTEQRILHWPKTTRLCWIYMRGGSRHNSIFYCDILTCCCDTLTSYWNIHTCSCDVTCACLSNVLLGRASLSYRIVQFWHDDMQFGMALRNEFWSWSEWAWVTVHQQRWRTVGNKRKGYAITLQIRWRLF